jgi:hypothetical protein
VAERKPMRYKEEEEEEEEGEGEESECYVVKRRFDGLSFTMKMS